ncbi:MAG: hypothetical protein ABFS12_03550 [Bacteroidota bacterium]
MKRIFIKKIIALFLLLIFTALTYFSENIADKKDVTKNSGEKKSNIQKSNNKLTASTTYQINITYSELNSSFDVTGSIHWINNTEIPLSEIFINVPTNRDKFLYNIDLKKTFNLEEFEFISTQSNLFVDSSLIKLNLNEVLNSGDTLKIDFQYSINSTSENHFLQFEDWYPSIAVYSSDQFEAYPLHKFIKSHSEFANFDVHLDIPNDYKLAVPGQESIEVKNERTLHYCSANNITSFNWMMFSNLVESSKKLLIKGHEVELKIFTHTGNESYIERYVDAVDKYLNRLSKYFGLSNNKLTIVEIPYDSKTTGKSYPQILAINFDMISPVSSQTLEYTIAAQLAEQYFGNMVATNNLEQSWLSKGISAYIAEKLVRTEFGDLHSYFNIAKYYPIKGLHFFSYSHIPLIYTLGEQIIPEGARFISEYYGGPIYGDMGMPSYSFPDYTAYRVSSIVKPQLAFLTLERFLGNEKIMKNLSEYYKRYSYDHPTSDQFIEAISDGCDSNSAVLIHDLFQSGKKYDYAIESLFEISSNQYELLVKRNEEGVVPISINVLTENDTIKFYWDGKDNFKRFIFYSNDTVISAQLDPQSKNILDLNSANNSYIIENQYWGSLSFAIRIFFWFQNALLIIGGIG